MKILVLVLVVNSLAEVPPYAPSGWRPTGPAFELPSIETNFQFNQRQQEYGSPQSVHTHSILFGTTQTQKLGQNSNQQRNNEFNSDLIQLKYKEYINQRNKLKSNISTYSFGQQLPKVDGSDQFRNTDHDQEQVFSKVYTEQWQGSQHSNSEDYDLRPTGKQLTYKEYIEQQNKLKSNTSIYGFGQQLPKLDGSDQSRKINNDQDQVFSKEYTEQRQGSQHSNSEDYDLKPTGKQLTYKEYIEQQSKLKSNTSTYGFGQQLPKLDGSDQSRKINNDQDQVFSKEYTEQRQGSQHSNFEDYKPTGKQLTYKEYNEQQNKLKSNTSIYGFGQQLPKVDGGHQYSNFEDYNLKQLPNVQRNYQFQSGRKISDSYLSTAHDQKFFSKIDVSNRQDVHFTAQQQSNQVLSTTPTQQYLPRLEPPNFNQQQNFIRQNFASPSINTELENSNLPNRSNDWSPIQLTKDVPQELRSRKQIPDQYLPAYNPNVTHVEEKKNKHAQQNPREIQTLQQTQSEQMSKLNTNHFQLPQNHQLSGSVPTLGTESHVQKLHRATFRSQNNAKRLKFARENNNLSFNHDGVYRTIILDDEDQEGANEAFGRRITTTRN